MSYLEIIKSCYDKYAYVHDTACCYRADIVSCEGTTFTVKWTQGKPKDAGDKTANVKTSYGCGWCLAPFLGSANVIMPFCPGSHVLVLNNNLSLNASEWSPDRFLIIGFDETFYNPGSNDALKPCIPNNLGFYFSNARYGAPYYIEKTKDDNGQIECTPINTWEEGGITLPRGTENNSGEIITIATSTGEITAIKPFQVPGFTCLKDLHDEIYNFDNVRGVLYNNRMLHILSMSVQRIKDAAYNLIFTIQETSWCNCGGLDHINYSHETAVALSLPYYMLGTAGGWLKNPTTYQVDTLPLPINGLGEISHTFLLNVPHISTKITPTINELGERTYITEETAKNVGSFSMSCGSFQPATAQGVIFEPSAIAGSRDYEISGEAILFDNDDGFSGHQTVGISGTTTQTYSNSGGAASGSLVSTDNSLIHYKAGAFEWDNVFSSYIGIHVTNVSGVRTDSSESTVEEINYYICALDIVSGSLIYLKQVFNSHWTLNGSIAGYPLSGCPFGMFMVDPVIETSRVLQLVLWTPGGEIVLEQETFSNDIGISYIFYPESMPASSPTFYDFGFLGGIRMPPKENEYIPFLGSYAYNDSGIVQYLDFYLNLPGVYQYVARPFSAGGSYYLPLVRMKCSLDGRQTKLTYTTYGVEKTRYFVDNVELFKRVDPNHWTSTDILNR